MKKKNKLRLSEYDKKCLEQVKELILLDLSKHHTLSELSSIAGINRFKLTYGFKQQYGSNVYVFLKKERMLLAKKLLTEKEKAIKKIAALCGYSNKQNFTTVFKKYFGKTPVQFQKSI